MNFGHNWSGKISIEALYAKAESETGTEIFLFIVTYNNKRCDSVTMSLQNETILVVTNLFLASLYRKQFDERKKVRHGTDSL